MFNTQVFGFQIAGQRLCPSCAERIYGSGLETHLKAGDLLSFTDSDQPRYAGKGLQCDNCLRWIFQPAEDKISWWQVDPQAEEQLRLLAPFADFLETLQIDVMNLRKITTR